MQNTVWSDLYARRSEWAVEAYKDFVATMHPSLQEDMSRQDHVTLAVYGPTQVGKTTLILTTLGVRDTSFGGVDKVLRGGQESGKSATVLATRYSKSRDESWWLGGQGPLTPEAMRTVLGDVRRRMEAGEDVGSDIVDIKIPRAFFDENRKSLDVSIIDLPGINAANPAEEAHVRRLAERYVPVADVVLLVTRVEHLGALHPTALALECLQDWAVQTAKFRVVLTYTFSAASVREWPGKRSSEIDSDGEFTAETLREKLFGQLSTHEMPLPEAGARCVFPVEFGKSWTQLSTQDGPYFDKASAISAEFMAALVDGLAAASNPYRRLAAAFDLNALVERKQRRLKAKYDESKGSLDVSIAHAQEGLEVAKKSLDVATRDVDAFGKLKLYLSGPECFAALEAQVSRAFKVEVGSPRAKTKPALRHAAREHEDQLICAWRELAFDDPTVTKECQDGKFGPKWINDLMKSRPSSPPKVEEAYDDFKRTVSGRFGGDQYTSLPWSSYDEDRASLSWSGKAAVDIAKAATMAWVSQGISAAKKVATRSLGEATKIVKDSSEKVGDFGAAHETLKEELADLTRAYAKTTEDMQDAIERSAVFRERMNAGYQHRDDALADDIAAERSAPRRFLLLALRDLHRREYPSVIAGHAT